ncbi:hypothetical protein Nepgr_012711 [Nepenthes gracilis]|uniref:DUF868 domain-containing protein n=1 Tax=Nepenthes gracilis TaxID=150966 RepID=A0AAD3SHD6_NEPGR|nr:hypothetical protein Nepgr_012711 [Nepenthes gracilis]
MTTRRYSSPFSPCFRPTTTGRRSVPSPPTTSGSSSSNPNVITCLYHTHLGLFILTWSRNVFGRSLHVHLLLHHPHVRSRHHHSLSSILSVSATPAFHLNLKPFIFWNKNGSKALAFADRNFKPGNIFISWDLRRAKFGSGPEPESGFYIAVVVDGEMALLVGDSEKDAYARTKAKIPRKLSQAMVIRREHVFGSRFYATKTNFGGKATEISIECNANSDGPGLCIKFDQKKVLQIKRLKWKFRGNERIEVDGQRIHLSWDVYNWLFEDENNDGYALFTFSFEKKALIFEGGSGGNDLTERMFWSDDSCGLNFEMKKMKKRLLMKTKSSSSLSSASSGCSSVMEWESVEENELKGPNGFSLLVYAWKS